MSTSRPVAEASLAPLPERSESGSDRESLFTLFVDGAGVHETTGQDFDTAAYSRFKYGDGTVTDEYGALLADKLIDTKGTELINSYIAASPIKHVPSAAHNLLQPLMERLIVRGYIPRGTFRIDRGVVKAVDYSSLSFTERQASNAGRQVVLPEVSRQQVVDHPVIVIDDIRVSGTTEAKTRKTLAQAGIDTVFYGYMAQLSEQLGENDSTVEHTITHGAVTTLEDLLPIAKQDDFRLNARTCKFILRATPEAVEMFAQHLPLSTYRRIITAMVDDEYHAMPEHLPAFGVFSTVFATRLAESTMRQVVESTTLGRDTQ